MKPRQIMLICLFAALMSSATRGADYTIEAGSTDVTDYLGSMGM